MAGLSTLTIQKSHNDIIEANHDATHGEDYFWSLCRPQYGMKDRTCISCGRDIKSSSSGHRFCAQCGAIKGPRNGLTTKSRKP